MHQHVGVKGNLAGLEAIGHGLAILKRVHDFLIQHGRALRFFPFQMRQAQRMLGDPACSVGEVAAACGYPDPFSFSRVFRQYCGRSPRQYRADIAGGP